MDSILIIYMNIHHTIIMGIHSMNVVTCWHNQIDQYLQVDFFLNQWMQVFVFGMLGGVDLPLTTCVFYICYHIEQLACGDELYRFNQVNIMAADARVPCFTRPSAAMILVLWYGQVLVGRALGRIPTTSLPIPCQWGGMIEIVTTCLCRCLKIARKELIQLTKLYNYDQSSCLFHSTWVSSAP